MGCYRLIAILILVCAAAFTSSAQTEQTTDLPQLIESRELTEKVVKLYGERRYAEALPLAKRALELGEAALGKTDARLIALLINLGGLYVETAVSQDSDTTIAVEHLNEARTSFDRALTIAEKNFGQEDLRLTRPLDELARLMSNKGEYANAANLLFRSYNIKRKHLPPTDIEVARAARTLGEAYRSNRDNSRAEIFYEQAIKLYEAAGAKDAELVAALKRYLMVLTAENKKDEAALVQAKLGRLSVEPGIVEGGVVNGSAVKLVQPSYPQLLRQEDRQMRVVKVQVLIDESGKVVSAKAEPSGRPDLIYPAFAGAAEDAALKSVFTPTIRSGAAVKVKGTIVFRFIPR